MTKKRQSSGKPLLIGGILLFAVVVVCGPLGMVIGGGFSLGQTAGMGAVVEEQCTPQGGGGAAANAAGVQYASDGPVRLPLEGKYKFTSRFGMRTQPVLGIYRLHAGVDLAMIPTEGPVLAAKDGTVESVNPNSPGAGNNITLDHGGGLKTRYLHMSKMIVTAGDRVKMGQQIGVEGNTTGPGGSISTGPHLHFEVHKNGEPTDPVPWLKKHGVDLPPLKGISTYNSKKVQADTKKKGDKEKDNSADVQQASSSGPSFALPKPNKKDMHSAYGTPAMPIPPKVKKLYKEAAAEYGLPWELLAGIGMEETLHGRNNTVSTAGALGIMQFMGATWIDFGVDGDGDGKAEITNTADSIYSAAKKLSSQGAKASPEGVRDAIHSYNLASWYVNDVLFYAHAYANGKVSVAQGSGGGANVVQASVPGWCPNAEQVNGGGQQKGSSGGDSGPATATKKCPKTDSLGEKGLQPNALNGLRCGKEHSPWIEVMFGVGDRAIADDHPKGLAVDYMIPDYTTSKSKKRAHELANWFKKNADSLAVQYVIYDQKIWNIDKADEGWRQMEDRGSPTQNHKDHVHVSYKETGKGADT